jgi:hypothetical protein
VAIGDGFGDQRRKGLEGEVALIGLLAQRRENDGRAIAAGIGRDRDVDRLVRLGDADCTAIGERRRAFGQIGPMAARLQPDRLSTRKLKPNKGNRRVMTPLLRIKRALLTHP